METARIRSLIINTFHDIHFALRPESVTEDESNLNILRKANLPPLPKVKY